ncbi:MAG: SgcJ/EcaC family oxidoreductase [Deltaproteobacteria bacterium]|nr:SgcJ/EcaC family oxidoreductase [Deltaproteobacteria bacterium]
MEAWNKRDAKAFEDLFILDGDLVGFDGTQMHGQGMIREHLAKVFGDHPTLAYTYRITGVTQISTEVAIVRAIAGMIPPGAKDFDPKLHAIHRLTAVHRGGAYRVALFQNTPARFDGRPQEVEQMTADLRAAQKQ